MLSIRFSSQSTQQAKKITGKVVDSTGEPIVGANVVVKVSTSNGNITNVDGDFTLSVSPGSKLNVSFIGYKTKTVEIGKQNSLTITLEEDANVLGEVEITAEFGMKRVARSVGSSVQNVKAADIIESGRDNFISALQGRVSGMNVSSSGGAPGSSTTVTLRSITSISGSNQPLYVVDGIPMNNSTFDPTAFADAGESFNSRNLDFASRGNDFNPEDIESMTVLKGAAAAALYGSDASNGAIIITTKKGSRNQDAKITYNGYVGIQKATNLLEMCNSHEYATMMLEANPEAYRSIFEKSVAEFGGNMENLQFNADTNWYDELLRTAMMTNHSLNISGGTEKATYSAGMSYLAQDGIMDVENYYRRLNFRAALDYEARKWLKVGFNGVFSNSQQQLPKNAAWQQAYNTPSIIPVYDDRRDDAVFPKKYTSPEQVGLTNNFNNPVATANYYDNRNETYQVLTNFYAQLNLIPDKLNIRSSYSYDYSMIRGSEFTPTYYVGTNQKKEVTELTKKNTNYYKYIWDNVATYTDKWGKHSFTGMLGASMRQEQYRLLEGTATNVPEGEDVWKYIALGNKEGATVKDDGWKYRGLSYFTRLNYNYNDKYMLMFTFRADGSSKYNDKWGYFPSIGAAWVISQEPFMKNQNIFDYMKLRASWGKLGNDKIAASAGFASIQNVQSVFGPSTAIDGFINTTNFSWLGWEVVNETNVGVNFSTLKNRLNADIDWYYRLTDNAVISPKLPMSGELLAGNNGQILNTGIDLSLNWNDKIGQDFNYNIGVNLSYLHNEVKSLKGNMKIIKGGKTVNMVGETMNSFYGYKVIGIYQTPEQCAADPIAVANGLEPGDFIYQDVNGDHVIDGNDKQVLGSYVPSFTYGFNAGFSYKNFDFSLTTYGQAGGELWNRKRALRYAADYYNFDRAQYENRWTGAGSTNEHPSAKALLKTWNKSDSNNASYFVESSDYFRIQNITLGYSFKNLKIGSYVMPGLRLSLTADRPFTTFKANSFTPEVSDAEGWDTEVYPLTSTYTFGVQIDF